ncbi:MAG TPA: ribosome biogenesis GTPase Der [Candidatus Sulfotelmatobacter sp.]|nr:ribosome biogenesis GTPase Der [Candidatus Sulfotelmatobacter sp.]
MSFTIAIVGRPNVGKSTLFNRLVGKRLALVDDEPGVTRDWREGEGRLGPLSFRLLDTAGLEEADPASLPGRMRRQTEAALADADLALFLIDARAGLTPVDRHFAAWLRKRKIKVLLLANKCEGRAAEAGRLESFALGLGDPLAISAEHGEGLADLYDAIAATMAAAPGADEAAADEAADDDIASDDDDEAAAPRTIQLAIVGRPNVGKSTLVNRLLGSERMLAGPEAGLTRDAIAVDWTYEGRPIRLVDTAGLRRKARVQARLEKLSVADALRSLRLAQVAVLLIDGTEPLDKQDLAIAAHAVDEGRALVLAVNKWDLVEDRATALKRLEERLESGLPQVRGVPVVTLSAKTGRHVDRLMPAVLAAYALWNKRVRTPELNRWLSGVTERHPPPAVSGRRIRLRYATQVKTRPPTFALFASKPGDLPESYVRYLANSLRETFAMPGVPLRLMLRKGKNPYVKE